MEQKIQNGIYRHYKGGIYEVIATACHSETLEDMIVYRNIETEAVWVRPASMWSEIVEHDGKAEPRFAFLAASLDAMDSKPLFKSVEDIISVYEGHDNMSNESILAYCHRESGEVILLTTAIGAYMDGDISSDELNGYEKGLLLKVAEIEDAPDNYVRLPYDGIWDEYDIMSDFALNLPSFYSEKLENALEGKGAFRRFKDVLRRLGLTEQWYCYRDSMIRREVRGWCMSVGIEWAKSFMVK